MTTESIVCAGCSEIVAEDQAVLRITAGVAAEAGVFGALLMRPDAYLHAGHPSNGPWGDEPNGERWCATPENFDRALAALFGHATSGGSGTYRGD